MRSRSVTLAVLAVVLVAAAPARAATGPKRLQVLAAAQTVHLFAHLRGTQVASPARCNEGQPPFGFLGDFLLPTLSFSTGDAAFHCHVTTRTVLVDLGGAVATEDARGDTYTTSDGDVLLFTRGNLERICEDLVQFYPPAPAPATVDGRPLGGTQVSTPAFPVPVRRTAPAPYWQDSVDVGHPGLLFASYCGWKAEVPLTRGRHVLTVDLTDIAGGPTRFRYDITVH